MIICPSPSALDDPDKYDDPEFNALIANLNLHDVQPPISSGTPPPRTPSPRPPAYSVTAHTFPSIRPRTYTRSPAATTPATPPVYHFVSPTQQGYTPEWSLAGSATQGVRGGHVHTVRSPRQKPHTGTKVAYVVFCGRCPGVYRRWSETERYVSRVSCCIFRGYTTVEAAEAAFAYALARSWTRVSDSSIVTAIPALPQPHPENSNDNPLHDTEALDNRWYNVYRGICPGVYRSHKRAELKLQSEEEQARVAALNKEYQATYRERHRESLATQAHKRLNKAYKDRYGNAMYNLYMKGQRERRRMAEARRRVQEDYDSGDDYDAETTTDSRRSS
ncbi:hypothetical protein B0H13DRAFT_2343485 [Mycena leptocephala]|nr:hypothetical protein B0H13DRAFT_2343485 [Mycena leptocephala]